MFNSYPIKQLIVQGLEEGVYPGAAISVGDAGGEIYRGHFGFRALRPERLAMEADTLFDLASLTKIVSTTMVAFKLMERGKLRLDDTLGDFFITPPDKTAITIMRLMTHTSGLPAHTMLSEHAANPGESYEHIISMDLHASPGEAVEYSCLGYILLGRICEILGGAPLDRLADDWVFGPIGMKRTSYNPAHKTDNAAGAHNAQTFAATEDGGGRTASRAPTYAATEDGEGRTASRAPAFAATEYDKERGECLSGVVHDENARFLGGVSGNAGVFSDISDLSAFAIMLANKGSLGTGRTFIQRELFDAAIINHTPRCDEARGLGFAVKARTPVSCGGVFAAGSYGHTGFTGTSIWVDAETSQYVVFLTNRVHPSRENNLLTPFRGRLHDCCATEYLRQSMR